MTLLTAFLVNLISVAVGTFIGNMGLLLLIGKKAQQVERKNIEKLQEIRSAALQKMQEDMRKKQEYIKMES